MAAAKCINALDVCPLVLVCSDGFFVSSGEEVVAEGTPPERQVSPNKLLRAALLRGRFADTILKAQEKTLQVDKVGLSELCVSVECGGLRNVCLMVFLCMMCNSFSFFVMGNLNVRY